MTILSRRTLLAAGAAAGAASTFALWARAARAAAPEAGKQAASFYRYKVGSIEITVVSDGINTLPVTPDFVLNAKVEEVNALQEMITVQLETQAFVEVRAKDIGEVPNCVDHAEGGCEDCAADGTLSACTVPTRDKPASGPSLPMA